jgi:Na+(H+)/acetate symporter ActP
MIIHFWPGKLGEKPDTLTQHADYYLKRGDRDYMLANPQNLCPVFTQEQLATSLCMTLLCAVVLDAAALVDSSIPMVNAAALAEDIKSAYLDDPIVKHEYNSCTKGSPSPCFSLSPSGLLLLDCCIYIPEH